MIQVTPQTRVLVAIEPADFRRGIDGLCRLCRELELDDPFCGALFVFRNRRSTAVKILAYDGQGFWLCQKRLSQGKFRYWPSRNANNEALRSLLAHELQVLLAGGDPRRARGAPQWRPLTPLRARAG
ncbi:MAG: IS66 family insertion sequence element accessory protein TnpB [bacterium]|nr:IS66 family insertion sequence element accessory protein TnpB [bacterium]